ncbi:MAG: bifunctional riboflavin kinase/FAD synthetase [Stygiobacter sp.]|jgi:riboflavin kinase/FMN adenylyltransferase|uniref:Riboflavin biosynthesis protein n=1 Tax=Stygiobacter electus TaxID=3032292 RepID=A0AAE3P0I3_9BACT|nr:bifunctional riboflavin kinase/FAD synthetase [Stygiobacter electus]MDF1610808.1 bifunctional riboflavin kinase/FAD synthetase [Stygiobacter electus]
MNIFTDRSEIKFEKKSVVTVGSFDGLHRGHIKIIKELISTAKKNNGTSVLVTFDPHPRSVLSKYSEVSILTSLDEKKMILDKLDVENLYVIHFTREFSQLSSEEFIQNFLIEKLNASHIVIGHDHKFGKDRLGDENKLRELGLKLGFTVSSVQPECIDDEIISSTKIRRFLINGELDKANLYLDRYYSICGIVVKGAQRGRTLGFPTANVQIDDVKKAFPKVGVYVTRCFLKDEVKFGVMNIGYRPTFENKQELVPEVYILDFNRDIYGEKIRVDFIKRLRDEIKFNSKDELINQIEKDKREAEKIASQIFN